MTTNNKFYIIAHNIRSLYNIGTMFRTADALGVDRLFLTGYSGQPPRKEISKVALGAEESVEWQHYKSLSYLIKKLKKDGIKIIALETSDQAINYLDFKPKFPLALLLGNEVRGVSEVMLKQVDTTISLPMNGIKESLNVGVAMAVAGYHIIKNRD
ncbi:MAG: TrmH family RNA methyltransferase [Candidatus Komeilibacteria bacterium]|mgnify:CR=1|jgi:23S rRNA (guanosine2251-2'-O)-methyltransferase|nr:TrmH family RNA methyltransferase [Candidatus Komeilibacteria bacterium]